MNYYHDHGRNFLQGKKMIKFTFRKQKRYGIFLYYPKCHLSEVFCMLMKKKSMSQRDVSILENHGFKIEMLTDVDSPIAS